MNLVESKVTYKHLEVDLMPARMALYAFFALLKKECTKDVDSCGTCTECFVNIEEIYQKQDKIRKLYLKLPGKRYIDVMSDTGIMNLDSSNFNSYKSKINRNLRQVFGAYAVKKLGISSIGTRPDTRYGIMLDRGKIEVVY